MRDKHLLFKAIFQEQALYLKEKHLVEQKPSNNNIELQDKTFAG